MVLQSVTRADIYACLKSYLNNHSMFMHTHVCTHAFTCVQHVSKECHLSAQSYICLAHVFAETTSNMTLQISPYPM